MEKRWVYGTKIEKWVLVDNTDRDYVYGLPDKLFKEMGEEKAKELYLATSFVKWSAT